MAQPSPRAEPHTPARRRYHKERGTDFDWAMATEEDLLAEDQKKKPFAPVFSAAGEPPFERVILISSRMETPELLVDDPATPTEPQG